ARTRLNGEEQDNEHWGDLTRDPGGVDYIETGAGGVPAMWAIPKDAAEDRVLLCIHGGGFIGGSIYTHRKLFGHLAKQAGARALIFNYRLPPSTGTRPRWRTPSPSTGGCSTRGSALPASRSPVIPPAAGCVSPPRCARATRACGRPRPRCPSPPGWTWR